ncbi:MAG: O-antigen ligase C-terminal domain-containing protein [Burkholderiales bacterium]|nr:O-antigen ligase C-terminal domain-containing protein [Burkholderiales bacterium]
MKIFAFLVAVAALLINQPLPPIVTMANQLAAILGFGLVLLLAPAPAPTRATWRAMSPLLAVFALAAAACALSIATGGFPSPPGIGVLGIIAIAAAVALHGASAGANDPEPFLRAFAIALVAGAVCQAGIAIAQTFAVDHLDNIIIAYPLRRGRVGGNIGQPNQFADAMIWGLIALVPLARAWHDRAGSRQARAGWFLAALFIILGLVLTGSRTAFVALALLAVWGLADRQLARPLRIALVASPVVAVLMSWGVHAIANAFQVQAAITDRSDATDVTSFRGEIWAQSLQLVKAQPWLGVGWGDFNLAWTLTPFGARNAGLVDNAHNLFLQLAVELGVPAALLMTGLLLAALVFAARRTWRLAGDAGLGARAALMIVVVMGLHSLLEYPLWYAYLLLPTAWAFGFAVGAGKAGASPARAEPAVPLRAWRWIGVLMVVLAPSAWLDYLNIVKLFLPDATSLPLEERVARAQASPLFANQADYVAVTNLPLTSDTAPLVVRSSHVLLNGRLMFLWANLLEAQGQVDKARFMAARLREFDLSGPRPWFAPCRDAAVTAKPFQCLAPEHPVTWRDFR